MTDTTSEHVDDDTLARMITGGMLAHFIRNHMDDIPTDVREAAAAAAERQ